MEVVIETTICDDINELERLEIAKYPDLENITHSIRKNKITVLKKSAIVEEREAKGTIKIKEDRITYQWYVNGLRKDKDWRFGLKRTKKEALKLAKEFQKSIYC